MAGICTAGGIRKSARRKTTGEGLTSQAGSLQGITGTDESLPNRDIAKAISPAFLVVPGPDNGT